MDQLTQNASPQAPVVQPQGDHLLELSFEALKAIAGGSSSGGGSGTVAYLL
jgi:hypothetical protein